MFDAPAKALDGRKRQLHECGQSERRDRAAYRAITRSGTAAFAKRRERLRHFARLGNRAARPVVARLLKLEGSIDRSGSSHEGVLVRFVQPTAIDAHYPDGSGRRRDAAAYDGFDRMLLNGRWTHGRSGQSFEDVDPYANDVLLRIPLADQADLDDAFAAAAAAQPAWSRAPPATRAAVLRRAVATMESRRAEIIDWLVHESGSTRIKAELEWNMARAVTLEAASFPSAAEGVMLAADIPGKESRIYRQPVGVVGMIGPWNFPLHLSSRSVAPAIALGNSVVVKPASDTPVSGGLPCPCVVLADADLDLAVRGAVFGKFLHQGQICMAINRLIVDASIHDEFVDRFKARVSRLKIGNRAEADTAVGPIINRQQLQRLLERIEQARAAGARQILGGPPQGLVLPPHIFVTRRMTCRSLPRSCSAPWSASSRSMAKTTRCAWRMRRATAFRLLCSRAMSSGATVSRSACRPG